MRIAIIGAALAALSLSLAGCGDRVDQITSPGTTAPTPTPVERGDALLAAASTAASIADALGQAPPATLSRTTIDERVIRGLFRTFDASLSVIDAYVASGALVRNSPRALTIGRGARATQIALNVASAAQRAGNATTYRQALDNAATAWATARAAIAQ